MKWFVFLHGLYPFGGSFMEGLGMIQGRSPATSRAWIDRWSQRHHPISAVWRTGVGRDVRGRG